ncbi:MAG: Tex family protein [Gammaproteobacteria bacterium]
MLNISAQIAQELSVSPRQTSAAIELLDEGSTVPFISRYRKEKTGGLDDTQLRNLEERLRYLRELEDRRETILKSVDEQGKLTEDLRGSIEAAKTKTKLEDLYLPYKRKRRTKAQIAREAGLGSLAQLLFEDPTNDPQLEAVKFLSPDHKINEVKDALDGAKQILMEQFSENAELIGRLREQLWKQGILSSEVIAGKEHEGQKFSDYFEYSEAINKIPPHRALAIFRGRNEGILILNLDIPVEAPDTHPAITDIANTFNIEDKGRAADSWLQEVVEWTWKIKVRTHLDLDLKMRLREQAEEEAIRVFSVNLNALLLAPPAGAKATLGLDPGIRTGVKVAVVDTTGKVVDFDTIYPHAPKKQWDASLATLTKLIKKHSISLISIGNGTASRETDKLAADLIKLNPDLDLQKLMVSEAGASVYSASEMAAKEFPDLDVSIRGAVSIARRLQDPLPELVKIDPKAIGVGQYQHDVNQTQLARSLEGVVENCVNAVGVDVNIASAALLKQVSGLNETLAQNMVEYRDANGAFKNRKEFLSIPRLGPKAYEQAAGFLRIRKGDNPLDASAVHPEAYPVVTKISKQQSREIKDLIGDSRFLKSLKASDYTDEQFGVPTIVDIITELEKPGRDPRPEFKTAAFSEGVEKLSDLETGMQLEGVVTNVTNFGAFVDIGVHQDGLVHVSQLADRFVKDPNEIVKAGDIVKVRITEVDEKRKRIALTMKKEASTDRADNEKKISAPATTSKKPDRERNNKKTNNRKPNQSNKNNQAKPPGNTAFGSALQQALKK